MSSSLSPTNWDKSSRYPIYRTDTLSTKSDCDKLLLQLVRKRKLCLAPSEDIAELGFARTFAAYGPSICCVVVPRSVTIPSYLFESTHFIYFPIDRKVRKQSNSIRVPPESCDYTVKRDYAYYKLSIDHQQLSELDQFIKENNLNNEFFADPAPQRLV